MLYSSLLAYLPYYSPVGLTQFAEELTVSRHTAGEHWEPDADCVLVVEEAGAPVAFVHASFLASDAHYSDLKAESGMLRFALAAPEHTDALRALVRVVMEAARLRGCPIVRAFAGYAPLFHNYGQSAVSNAWPWIARSLVQEGFATLGRPALAMFCSLNQTVERLPLPEGADLRYDWVTRIGERDDTEGGFHIFFGPDRAAESMWHFGEKYVQGAGNTHAHLFWLGTNEPYRGQGLGRILLRETLARAQELGARTSDLRCNVDNFYAHSLYGAVGYEPCDLLWAFQWSG